MHGHFYGNFTGNLAHAQSVCTRPFSRGEGPGDEAMQNQSTAVFPSRSTIGKIEIIPQMGMTLKMFAPNAILNQQC